MFALSLQEAGVSEALHESLQQLLAPWIRAALMVRQGILIDAIQVGI